MSERVFHRLATLLADDDAVVLASVLDTRGATPRKRGARMLVTAAHSEFSVGGGMAEARVLAAARALLDDDTAPSRLDIVLDGGSNAAGICGGRMQIALRRWHGADDRRRADILAATLGAGGAVTLEPADTGADRSESLAPDPRLLIVGAGHCGLALHEFARALDFDIWVFDPRESCFAEGRFAGATVLCGEHALLARALDTERELLAVLLNRDYISDVATLDVLAARPPAYIGMMGSRRRVQAVLDALPQRRDALQSVQAPVGLDIGAETPHEIAVSVLAGLLAWRAARARPADTPAAG